ADQLVLQVGNAHIEPECLQAGPRCAGPKPTAGQRAADVAFLADVAQAGELDVDPARPEHIQEVTNAGGTAHGYDMNAPIAEDLATRAGQSLQCGLVAPAFDEHRLRCRADAGQIDTYPGNVHHAGAAGPGASRNPTLGVCPARHAESNG